jgi:hypothetical protein
MPTIMNSSEMATPIQDRERQLSLEMGTVEKQSTMVITGNQSTFAVNDPKYSNNNSPINFGPSTREPTNELSELKLEEMKIVDSPVKNSGKLPTPR